MSSSCLNFYWAGTWTFTEDNEIDVKRMTCGSLALSFADNLSFQEIRLADFSAVLEQEICFPDEALIKLNTGFSFPLKGNGGISNL